MMVSPKAARALGDRLGTQPVCAGPYRFVQRVAQGKITVERVRVVVEPDAEHALRVGGAWQEQQERGQGGQDGSHGDLLRRDTAVRA